MASGVKPLSESSALGLEAVRGRRVAIAVREDRDNPAIDLALVLAVDVSGSVKYGHMHHAVFTMVDADHHMEDWTYMMPGDKPMHAHMDLSRTK